ncbi:GGDEF domain-containing response regulator [Leptothoe sp. PORK10 BA2]|uniref:GGDEF domain-containing response regulator n=1 Tax=Leptothoe sp. PORK10 BA2 TaxID=3110254 RepID=UPI002B211DE6|nr:diguanylate cyclase [Leptothoe sp. PORK10 BA2]MEA5466256.1 diguanylate cyclase [Leptothoe sp. PORK10 BA2]
MKSTTNILLIEDNPDDVFLINTLLEQAEEGQFKVTPVNSFASALACLQKKCFDIALLDLSLPDSQGIETLLSLREQAPSLPTVVLTEGKYDPALAGEIMQYGAQDYLVKGKISQNWLNRTIIHAIARFQKNAALFETERQYQQKLIRRIHAYETKIASMDGRLKVLETLSFTDGLTEISNRYHFEVVFHQNWLQACQHGQPLSLIMVDIDCFKQFNDSLGHLEGDRCLRQIAQALEKTLLGQPGGMVARYGGEEFVVVLPNVSGQAALDVATKLRLGVHDLGIRHPNSTVNSWVTASFGVASTVPTSHISTKNLIYKADRALYVAKANGRDRISYYQPSSLVPQLIG